MGTMLRTRRAIAADNAKAPAAFAAVHKLAPDLAERLDDAHVDLADAEGRLADVNDRLRRLNPPAVYREHVVGQRRQDFDEVDEVERRVLLADLDSERLEASRRVQSARQVVESTKREAASLLLQRGASRWSDREIEMLHARAKFEQSFVALIRDGLAFAGATAAELAAAREANAIAREALTSDEARDALVFAARTRNVAVGIDDDGHAVTVDRPEKGLFGEERVDSTEIARLLDLILSDPDRARRQLAGSALGKQLEITR
jgi:hypothetical protein